MFNVNLHVAGLIELLLLLLLYYACSSCTLVDIYFPSFHLVREFTISDTRLLWLAGLFPHLGHILRLLPTGDESKSDRLLNNY